MYHTELLLYRRRWVATPGLAMLIHGTLTGTAWRSEFPAGAERTYDRVGRV
jgi:hypothetical protein